MLAENQTFEEDQGVCEAVFEERNKEHVGDGLSASDNLVAQGVGVLPDLKGRN